MEQNKEEKQFAGIAVAAEQPDAELNRTADNKKHGKLTAKVTTKTLAKIAILSALSFVLYMWIKFPLPMLFPSFLDVQFSELPALLGWFSMGPIAGCAIIVIKCLIKLPFTTTACVGELSDLLLGIAIVLPASLIYKKYKNKKGAFIGLIVGVACNVVLSILVNWLVLIPTYVQLFFGGNWEVLLNIVRPLYADVTLQNFYAYYLFLGVAPFNLLRLSVTALLTFLLYKRVSPVLHL